MHAQDGVVVLVQEGHLADQHLVQQHPQGVYVCALIESEPEHRLWRHVPGGPQDRLVEIGGHPALLAHRPRRAEIQQLDPRMLHQGAPHQGPRHHDHVVGFDVRTDNGLGVEGGEPFGHLSGHLHRYGDGERSTVVDTVDCGNSRQ